MKKLLITYEKAPDYETTGKMIVIQTQEIEVPDQVKPPFEVLVDLMVQKGYLTITEAESL